MAREAQEQKKRTVRNLLKWRIVLPAGYALLLSAILAVVLANYFAERASDGKVYSKVDELSEPRVALLFGCNPMVGERPNLYFTYRIDAALRAWNAGKVLGFIVSGDHSREDYDEPQAMFDALVAGGVPKDSIVCDYAGLRTLDSVVRAQKVFGVNELLCISQEFQNVRALYIADYHAMDAVAYCAQDVADSKGMKTKIREYLARPKMLLDLHVLGVGPKFLGKKESIPFAVY